MRKLWILLFLLIPGLARAEGFGYSVLGQTASVSYEATNALDSARVWFGFDGDGGADTLNYYASLKLLPCISADKKILSGDGLELDSVGTHIVKIIGYASGAIAEYSVGIWVSRGPVSASVDSGMVRRAVHYADATTYGDSTGTLGKALVDAASCNPSGSNTVVITTKRTTDSTVVIRARIQANQPGGSVYYLGYTDNAGHVSFACDNDTLLVYPYADRISFTAPETLQITGNTSATYYGMPFTPSSPPTDSVCVVYGYVLNKDGTGYVGARAEIWMETSPVTYHGSLVDVGKKTVVRTDTSGLFEFTSGVYPTSLFDQDGLLWTLRVSTTTWIWEGKIDVPTAAAWEVVIPSF